jgi:hypothetical protein
VDPSVQDAAGHHSAALFVQWVPRTQNKAAHKLCQKAKRGIGRR